METDLHAGSGSGAGAGTSVGPVPGRILVDVIMGVWGGLFCLLVVDLVSRFAGIPIPGSVMLPFLVLGFLSLALFGTLVLLARGELVVAGVSFLVAFLLLLDAACCLLCRSYRSAQPLPMLP